jgi:hypothetical protein
VNLRVLLSHAFLQQGIDNKAAEEALLHVLALAPDHAEAKNNLAVVRAALLHPLPRFGES